MRSGILQFASAKPFLTCAFAIALMVVVGRSAPGQSTQQDFPTPVTESEISGTIKPRDVGDARLTTHYYLLEAGPGDLFVNVASRNLNADFDVFYLGTLQPVTKVVVFAETSEFETGRVLYFRKPEKLLLRVQGRTPGDETATYRLKFAGSFVASRATITEPEVPKATIENEGGIRVNSVGTILPSQRKPVVTPKAKPATDEPVRSEENSEKAAVEENSAPTADNKNADENAEKPPRVIVTENVAPGTPVKTAPRRRGRTPARGTASNRTGTTARTRRNPPRETTPAEPKPDPLANIQLVILFKDGSRIERPLPEVLRFTVDRGILTVISKDGTIGRYSMVDVAKVTIE